MAAECLFSAVASICLVCRDSAAVWRLTLGAERHADSVGKEVDTGEHRCAAIVAELDLLVCLCGGGGRESAASSGRDGATERAGHKACGGSAEKRHAEMGMRRRDMRWRWWWWWWWWEEKVVPA